MGMLDRYLSKIELGRHNIAVLALLRLAHALDIPAACLLARLDMHALRVPLATCDAPTSGATQAAAVTHNVTPSLQPSDPAALLHLLGVTLRQYRQQQGLTHKVLAAKTGLTPTYIGEIEHGKRNLSVLSLVHLADALGLAIAHLLAPLETR
jgi:transcriptional regulator with XRE-family HTH domain